MVSVLAVLADGQLGTVNWDGEYKDLMWGLMGGGGGQLAMVLEFTMRIHKSPAKGYSTTFLEYSFDEQYDESIAGTNERPGYYDLSSLKPIYKAWLAIMESMKDDPSIGGSTFLLARNFENLETRQYRLAFAGFCKDSIETNCEWGVNLREILAKFPAKVKYMDHRSSFNKFGVVGEIVPLVKGYPLEKYRYN